MHSGRSGQSPEESRLAAAARDHAHEISISRIEISVPIEIERVGPASGSRLGRTRRDLSSARLSLAQRGAYRQILASRTFSGDRLSLPRCFVGGLAAVDAVSTYSRRTNVLAFWPGRVWARRRGRGGASNPVIK